MIIGCVAINKIPVDKVYIKFNILIPNKNTSMLIIFLLKIKYHLIYLLVKKFKILSIFIRINILNNKTIIKPVIIIEKKKSKILKSNI